MSWVRGPPGDGRVLVIGSVSRDLAWVARAPGFRAPRPLYTRAMLTGVAARLDDGWQELVDPAWLEGWAPQPFEAVGRPHAGGRDGERAASRARPVAAGLQRVVAGLRGEAGADPSRRHLRSARPVFGSAELGHAARRPRARVLDAFAPGPALVVGH